MKELLTILLLIALSACNNLSVTDTEAKAVDAVLRFYGGVCNRHKGFKSDNGVTEKYFELEMSKSELIESYSTMLEMPASNIAYLFYSNLNNEKDNYTHIKVKINLSNGESHEYYYSAGDLKEIEKLIPTLQIVSDKIKSRDYEGIISLFDAEVASTLSTDQLKKYCTPYDSAFGEVDKTQFQGFSFDKIKEDGMPMAHLSGIMLRAKENTPISIYIDRQSKKIVTLKYKF